MSIACSTVTFVGRVEQVGHHLGPLVGSRARATRCTGRHVRSIDPHAAAGPGSSSRPASNCSSASSRTAGSRSAPGRTWGEFPSTRGPTCFQDFPQHLRGRHRTAARADPAGQRDGVSHDNALPREPRSVTEFVFRSHHVHIGTLQILGDLLQTPGMRVVIFDPRVRGAELARRVAAGSGSVSSMRTSSSRPRDGDNRGSSRRAASPRTGALSVRDHRICCRGCR